MCAQTLRYPDSAAAAPFHARLRAAIARIPTTIGTWQSTEVPIPPSAQQLLRPNALFSRRYRDSVTGLSATVILIQCRDPRDMSGHYPPNCYPASGWSPGRADQRVEIPLWGRSIPFIRYEFERYELGRSITIAIYSVFVMPATGIELDMAGVRAATGDYRARPFGAAQLQVVMDASIPPDDARAVVRELAEPIGPIVGLMRQDAGEASPRSGP